MDNQPIVLERIFNVPVSIVWKAITDRNEMKKWYFDLAEFKAETGFRFQFPGGPDPAKPYLHLCEITEVIPGKKLTYSWQYDGYAGISFVTFELFDQDGKTLLKFNHQGIETFPRDNPDLAKGNFVEGWNQIIHNSLKEYLEKNKTMLGKKNYSNGNKVYELTGTILTYFFKNGLVKAEGVFDNGLMEGEWKFYRETGQLWVVGNFKTGKKNGTWIRYDKNGRLEYHETFKDDKLVKKEDNPDKLPVV